MARVTVAWIVRQTVLLHRPRMLIRTPFPVRTFNRDYTVCERCPDPLPNGTISRPRHSP